MADPKLVNATLKERRDSASDLAVFRFEPEQKLSWEPGQYATIGIMVEGKRIERPYSIASSPHEKAIEFFIEMVPDGALTQHIFKLKVGDTVTIRPRIVGKFTLERESGRKTHFQVATVTGVAPYVSAIRFNAAQIRQGKDEGHKFYVIHGGSRSWELNYVDELSRLQKEVDWLTYVPTISRPWEDPDWTGEKGRAEDIIRKHFDTLDRSDVTAYLCGHPGMIEGGKGILLRAGLEEEQFREESYF